MTRAPDHSTDFVRLLEDQGAQVTSVPLIRIGPPPNERALQEAVDRAGAYTWLIFTSVAGVESFARRRRHALESDQRVAAVGPATEHAVAEHLGRRADIVPGQFSGGALADALVQSARPTDSMLIVAAHDASPVLASKLREAGFRVDTVDAYTTVENPPHDLMQQLAANDAITLASPSAVRALVHGLGEHAQATLRGKLLACIGPVTLFEARERGLHVEIVPDAATMPALVQALCRYYTTSRP